MMKLNKIFLLPAILIVSFSLFGQIEFSQKKWEIDILLKAGQMVSRSIEIINKNDSVLNVNLLSTCSCLDVSPRKLVIESGETGLFELRYTAEDEGEFIKRLIITTDSESLPKAFFPVSGKVELSFIQENPAQEEPEELQVGDDRFRFYYAPGCKYCENLIDNELAEIESRFPDLKAQLLEVDSESNLEAVLSLQKELRGGNPDFPVLYLDNALFQGEREIDRAVNELLKGNTPDGAVVDDYDSEKNLLLPAGVFTAGLLDGINPCAFTSLIFLLSALSVAGKTRRNLIIVGLGYTFAVYLSYFLIGLGFWGGIHSLFPHASFILNWLLLIFLVVMAVLSLIDYLKVKKGQSEEMILQLPSYFKKKIHNTVRHYTRSGAILGGAFVLGVLVSLFELGCTGQIYLPTLTFMARNGSAEKAVPLLLLYNTAFIIPLALVFFLCYRGLTSQKLALYFENRLAAVKLLTFILFVIMGIFSALSLF